LVDPAHVMVGLFGMTNVPFAIWIDEDGTIVRPAEIAFAPRQSRTGDAAGAGGDQSAMIAQLPERQRRIIEQMTVNPTPTATRWRCATGRPTGPRAGTR
jgi:hypothetical protein